jgi:hypothetical protein
VQQGTNAIAIGYQAGYSNQSANSIVLNATGSPLDGVTESALFVDPIRNVSNANILTYNSTSKEVTYVAKTFVIDHPTNPNKYLVHACLEGPEAGVYYRGTARIPTGSKSVTVSLPEYVDKFATDLTVHITPVGEPPIGENGELMPMWHSASHIQDGTFKVYGTANEFNWIVHGKRGSIEVEPDRTSVTMNGSGPYRWLS